jgi:VWFA-related protein
MIKPVLRALASVLLVLALIFALGGTRVEAAEPQGGSQQGQGEQQPSGATISVEVPVVTLDVVATTQHGDIITGLNRENFRVFEDGAAQTVTNFGPAEAPITMVILMEFSSLGYGWFAYNATNWAPALLPELQPKDWVALVTFDIRPRLEVDFTQNKQEIQDAIRRLVFPGFHESNVFDAVLDTIDRMKDVKGKKSILLLASGRDTFSRHRLDETLKALRQTDVTIFSVSLARLFYVMRDAYGMGGIGQLNFAQAESQMRTFAQLTGGYAWFPMFDGEIPAIFKEVAGFLRHQYNLAYTPTNRARDGKYRKIKVELVNSDGSPFTITDQKGKKLKCVVYARQGYTAPVEGAGD